MGGQADKYVLFFNCINHELKGRIMKKMIVVGVFLALVPFSA